MIKIQVQPRRFLIDLDEREVAALAVALEKFNVVTSPAYALRKELIRYLGYEPTDD